VPWIAVHRHDWETNPEGTQGAIELKFRYPVFVKPATLGFVTFYVGLKAPAVMWIAFLPMACIASAFFYLNRADPDCGTNFSWVTRAMGPRSGWLTGWGILIADLVVMPSLAYITGRYVFLLLDTGEGVAGNRYWIMLIGVAFILAMTLICVIGIALALAVVIGVMRPRLGASRTQIHPAAAAAGE